MTLNFDRKIHFSYVKNASEKSLKSQMGQLFWDRGSIIEALSIELPSITVLPNVESSSSRNKATIESKVEEDRGEEIIWEVRCNLSFEETRVNEI